MDLGAFPRAATSHFRKQLHLQLPKAKLSPSIVHTHAVAGDLEKYSSSSGNWELVGDVCNPAKVPVNTRGHLLIRLGSYD